jgi:hypothetical protein
VLKQEDVQEKIIVQAMKDDAFRQRLLNNPKMVLERELRLSLPPGVDVQVHEETTATIHLVLPPLLGEPQEVDDADLMAQEDTDYGTAWPNCCCACSHTVQFTVSPC